MRRGFQNYFPLFVFLGTILLPVQLIAAVFSHDWKTPGDGLLTYDDVNQREWLDLSETLLTDQFPGANLQMKYRVVLSETRLGGLFEGFSFAKSTDVIALAESAGIDTSTQEYATNSIPTTLLGNLLGLTVPEDGSRKISVGLIDEFETSQDTIPLSAVVWTLPNQAGLIFGKGHAQFGTPPGVMLYRVISEPIASKLVVVGAVSLVYLARCYIRQIE